ncbi:cytochrome b/b6 domain-containing protein [Arthrobacter sp. MYb224]|uniref:cytochrome b/b6 domain-containing protein n=1 Tax=Arthrobacter sp. MYb224 TaxID=1848600 RepID=UPI0021586374|nr:cytochrome b/b6 domain-containing protein [Arthrobacter sp. MYb224]
MRKDIEAQPQPEPSSFQAQEDLVAGKPAHAETAATPPAGGNRRRMAGASNAPLLVSSSAPYGTATAVSTNSPAAENAQPPARTEIDAAVSHDQLREVPSKDQGSALNRGRRMPGPSTVPVVVALQESRPANEPASVSFNQQIPAAASNRAAGEASSVPERQRLRQASQPASDEYAQRASAEIADGKREPAQRSAKSLASENSTGSANALNGDVNLDSRNASKTPSKYAKRGLQIGGLLAIAVIAVLAAQWLRSTSSVQEFIAAYPGHASQPISTPEGIPAWLGWQHFLNMFFMVLIVRSGLQVRLQNKPPGFWTAKKRSFFSPGNQPPKKISITQWLHQLLDVAWVVNGLLFVAALFITGFWMRIVPTSWDVFPNLASAGLQYLSLDWPEENGWIHYNALQVMAYFITVFVAAPLAIISGARMSTWWPAKNEKLSKLYPIELARAVHIPVMVYFVAFTLVHVFLVFFTGARRNLNHMFTSRDVADFWGLVVFGISVVAVAAAWFLTSPMFIRPIAGAMGKVSKN